MAVSGVFKSIGPGQPRALGPIARALSYAISFSTAILFLAIAFGVYVEQFIALYLFLGAVLSLAFLHQTGNVSRPRRTSFFSALLVILSMACCGYMVFSHQRLSERLPVLDPLTSMDIGVSILLMILVLEATRRCIGVTLVVLVLAFLGYALVGDKIDGPFAHRGMSIPEMVDHLVFTPNGLFGPALEVAAFLVFVFVVFGALFDRFGGGDFFYQLAKGLVGNKIGGTAKVSVVSSALYGSVSGSPTADVVTTGSFTIPLMVKTGYTKVRASAVEAAASTGGSLLPPVMGSAAFLMSDFTGIAYSQIVIAAIIPAFFYFFCIYMSVHNHAVRHNLTPVGDETMTPLKSVFLYQWPYFIPLITIAWAVLALNRPSFAGALACLAIVPVMLWKTRPITTLPKELSLGLCSGVERIVTVGVACAVAGLVIGTLSMTDLTGKISSAMFALASGSHFLTVMTAVVVIIILGMGMPVPAVYALSAVLAAPALIALGAEVLSAHMFIVYFAAISAITPPVAVAAFAAASISGTNPMSIAFMACRIGMVAFIIPLLFLQTPALLMSGDYLEIAKSFVVTLIACYALAGVNEGYLHGQLTAIKRAVLIVGILLALVGSGIYSLIGCALLVGAIAIQRISNPSLTSKSKLSSKGT
jgi:TRAP transporter 4TM/12TM fusion protein